MIYLERSAPPGLEGPVRRVWFLETPRARPYEKILPLPWIHLIVNLSTPYRIFTRDRTPLPVADAFVSGPHAEYLITELPETIRHVGVELEPNALSSVSAVSPARVVGRVQPAAAVIDGIDEVASTLRRGSASVPPGDALDAIVTCLADAYRPVPADPVASAVLAAIREDPARPIGDLAIALGVSHRTLIGRFRGAVGMAPKAYAQVWRFHTLISSLGSGTPGWADVAVSSRYYDQADVIRAFRRFTGWTPGEYLKRVRASGPDAALFVPLSELPPPEDQPTRS